MCAYRGQKRALELEFEHFSAGVSHCGDVRNLAQGLCKSRKYPGLLSSSPIGALILASIGEIDFFGKDFFFLNLEIFFPVQ